VLAVLAVLAGESVAAVAAEMGGVPSDGARVATHLRGSLADR
jgi:hypothetical protein